MSDYDTLTKNKLISIYDSIWESILITLVKHNNESIPKGDSSRNIIELTSFTKMLDRLMQEVVLDSSISYLPCDDGFKERLKILYIELVSNAFEVVEQLNILASSSLMTDGKKENLQFLLGKIAMAVRFDILSPPDDSFLFNRSEGICPKLETARSENRDYYQVRPLWQRSIRKFLPQYAISDTAIVMQGPVIHEDDFTFESLLRYRKIYPESLIILSTWKNQVEDVYRLKLESIGIVVMENDVPTDPGPSNIALQIASSRKGIEYAGTLNNIKYVLKTRTDQRFFMPEFLIDMRNKINDCPPYFPELNGRLIFLGGLNSLLTFTFRLTDFMTFGLLKDIERFYEAPVFDERLKRTYESYAEYHYMKIVERVPFDNLNEVYSLGKEKRMELSHSQALTRDPESYLAQSFYERVILNKVLGDNDDIFEHYWSFLKKGVIIIDPEQIMFYWHKYRHKSLNINSLLSDGGLTESVWRDICNHDF